MPAMKARPNLAALRKKISMQNMGLSPNQYRKKSRGRKLSVLGKTGGTGPGLRARVLIAAGRKPSSAGAFKWSGVTLALKKTNVNEVYQRPVERDWWDRAPVQEPARKFELSSVSIPESARFKRVGHSNHKRMAHRGAGPVSYGTAKARKSQSRAAAKAGKQGARPGREAKKKRKK